MEDIITALADFQSPAAANHCKNTLINIIESAIETVGNKISELEETLVIKMMPSINRFLMEGAELLNRECNSIDRLMQYLDENLFVLHDQLNEDNFKGIMLIILDKIAGLIQELTENALERNSACLSTQDEDIYTLDWGDYDYPTVDYNIINSPSKPVNEEESNDSSSSAATITVSSEIKDSIKENEANDSDISVEQISPTKSNCSFKFNYIQQNVTKKHVKSITEQKNLEKQKLREDRKAEEIKKKLMKAALLQKHKSIKPEENIKLLTINIDTKIINSEFGGILIASLQQSNIQYNVKNQIKPFVIYWTKKVKDILVNNEGILIEDTGEKVENQLLYIIKSEMIVRLVVANELLAHIQTVKSVYPEMNLTVVIIGMQAYFNLHKKTKHKENNINFKNMNKKRVRVQSTVPTDICLTKEELQHALIEIQLFGKYNHRLIETAEELSSLVISTTKSLSQLDYKMEKHKREEGELEWFAKADSKQCVKVDKNGIGLAKLWQQQICQFNNVGLEAASAIVSSFHSPQNLLDCYKNCSNICEAELLLQNIQIRRNAGILTSVRRVGPEVSRKIFQFYTADDPDLEL